MKYRLRTLFVLMAVVSVGIPICRQARQWRQRQQALAAIEKRFAEAREHDTLTCIQYLGLSQQIVDSTPALRPADRDRLTRQIAPEIARLQSRYKREREEESRLTSCAIDIADDSDDSNCDELEFGR